MKNKFVSKHPTVAYWGFILSVCLSFAVAVTCIAFVIMLTEAYSDGDGAAESTFTAIALFSALAAMFVILAITLINKCHGCFPANPPNNSAQKK